MIKDKWPLWPIVATMAIVALAGCASKEERALERYVAALTDARVHESRVEAVRERVHGWLAKPDAEPPVDLVRQELLPAQQEFVRALEAMAPDDPELTSVHDRLLAAERRRLNGAYEVDAALKPDDGPDAFRRKFAMMVVNEATSDALRERWYELLGARCRALGVACEDLKDRAAPR